MKSKPKAERAKALQLGRSAQHYTAFTVEFLLSARRRVRRTKVTYVPTGESETWPGWAEARLTASFVKHADLRLPAPPISAAVATEEAQPALDATPRAGRLQLADLTLLGSHGPGLQLAAGAAYELCVRLTARDFKDLSPTSVTYLLIVFARELGSGARHVAAASSGWLRDGEREIKASGQALRPGLYRLEAFVSLVGLMTSPEAWLEGSLLQVW